MLTTLANYIYNTNAFYNWCNFFVSGPLNLHHDQMVQCIMPTAVVLRSSDKLFRILEFFSEKIILGPREVQISWFLVLWSMTHYILRLVFFRDQPTPPICLKMPKCAKFSTFWESHEKNHLQVGVHRENFLIGNLAQNVFMVFYICWEHNISFSAKFPMRKFSPSPSPSPSSLSHGLLQNWLKFRK